MNSQQKTLVRELIADSAMLIDMDDLDAWLACFDDAASYMVLPRENVERGLKVAIIHCPTKASLIDRVVCLRHANKFNPHYDRHIVGPVRFVSEEGDVASTMTNFIVVQSTKAGEARLFCAGYYEDRIRVEGERAAFLARRAVLDSFSVPTLLATPV